MRGIVTTILAALVLFPGLAPAADRKTSQESPAPVAAAVSPQKLDVNRASTDELVGVPGIGPSIARAIVDLRSRKGSFTRLEELLEVPGIKEKTFASITAYLAVTPPQAPAATASGTTAR